MIIVTGANGFIGSALVWELNQKGYKDIICVDTVSLNERDDYLKHLKYHSFLQKNEIWNFLSSPQARNVEVIFHMGACSSTTETNREFLYENNTQYTNRLFEWCAEKRIPYIYASSAATYGAGELGFREDIQPEALKPLNLYGLSKVESDRWALQQKNTPPHWYGLRFFNVYGPNEYHKKEMASVVFKAYHQILKSKTLTLFRSHKPEYKDGEQLRDFVYVKDITRWMLELWQKRPESGIYNMGYGKARTWLALAENTFSGMRLPLQIQWIDMPLNIREQYQYFTEARMEKLMSQHISSPEWPLERGIRDYVENYLLNENPCLKI